MQTDTAGMTAITVIVAIACCLVLLETGIVLRNLGHLKRLDLADSPAPDVWPRVSVIMAARDEVDDIGAGVRARLADDYPDLEVILVDDRSTDGTGDAALAAADGDPRFALVRVDELPEGWLGKVNAMQRGLERATGQWLLLSDGDVIVEPHTTRQAIAYCEQRDIDMLALVPSFQAGSFFIDGVWTVFLRALIALADPAKVRDPKSKVVLGAGAFNLVRRNAYDATPGFEHLRMETGDDVALASLVKKAGHQVDLVDGARCATVAIYRSLSELMHGIEKNGSTTATISFPLLVLGFVLLGSAMFSPFVALALGPEWLRVLGLATLIAYTGSEAYALWRNTRMWAPALIWPLAFLIMVWAMLRSTWLAHKNGGVYWRETFYSLEELEAGRRFKL